MATIISKFKKIKCPCCNKKVIPEVINSRGGISICPLCKNKISG